MSSVLVFLVNMRVILNKFFLQLYFVLFMQEGCKRFYGNKRFNFCVFCFLQKIYLQILTISLQINFHDFMKQEDP